MKDLKLWQKQYLSTLLLFLLAFYGCVFFLAHSGFSAAFTAAQESAMQEYAMIRRGIQAEQGMVAARGGASLEADTAIVAEYGAYYSRRGVGLSFAGNDGALLYSSMAADELMDGQGRGILELKENGDGIRYFCISAPVGGGILGYVREAESLFARQRQQNLLLLCAAAAFALILSIFLYITLRRVYRPIDELAHELRTPLTAIHGYAQYIALAAIDEEERLSAAAFIADESRRLRDIVDRLLTLSNRREGEPEWEQVSVRELFDRAEKLYPIVRCRVDQPYVMGDAALLGSLVGNLVDNALKASPQGAEVELISEQNSITVLDRGKGLSEAMLRRLNDPEGSGGSTTGGAGLGIPLCHQIAGLHGARLTFQNRTGGGTIARVEFLQLQHNLVSDSKYGQDTMEKKQGGMPL